MSATTNQLYVAPSDDAGTATPTNHSHSKTATPARRSLPGSLALHAT